MVVMAKGAGRAEGRPVAEGQGTWAGQRVKAAAGGAGGGGGGVVAGGGCWCKAAGGAGGGGGGGVVAGGGRWWRCGGGRREMVAYYGQRAGLVAEGQGRGAGQRVKAAAVWWREEGDGVKGAGAMCCAMLVCTASGHGWLVASVHHAAVLCCMLGCMLLSYAAVLC